ncbi:hypothetical protein PQI07_28720 [Methylobacterium sp. 092160098-2]|uniref:SLAC1 family transporter n=1 Tax=Methylobacterium sp. 092160098-2 TaxID=3025129 RepID=UPI0023819E34|nr:hypothetical protein [Methylobacterium sp. 092160098-2]MDE4914641.1 hypothetical protein [Methylobacterium sp. 092160098-2]
MLFEARDPTSSFFASLAPVATMIASVGLAPHWPGAAWAMASAGLVGATLFAVWGVGGLWMGDRAFEATTPILHMPTVGGGFVAAITCAAFGMKELGLLFFGAGLLSWLTLESVIIHRLILQSLPVPLRASLGLHLAPPAVACVAYLAVTDGPPDRLAQILFGYALLHALVMVRLVPWLRQQPFSPAAWAYTFGVLALPLAALRLTERGLEGPSASLAVPLFAAANLIIAGSRSGPWASCCAESSCLSGPSDFARMATAVHPTPKPPFRPRGIRRPRPHQGQPCGDIPVTDLLTPALGRESRDAPSETMNSTAASSGAGTLANLAEIVRTDVWPQVKTIDAGAYPEAVLRRLGSAGAFERHVDGTAAGVLRAVDAMSEVATACLSTAFCTWCQDALVWCLARSAEPRVSNELAAAASGARLALQLQSDAPI